MNTMKSSMTRMIAVLAIALVFVAASTGSVARAQTLEPTNRSPGDYFGAAAGLMGNTALVGQPSQDVDMGEKGMVYLFNGLDTTDGIINEDATLTYPESGFEDLFGYSIDTEGTTAVVGAPNADQNSEGFGNAFIYHNLPGKTGTISPDATLQVDLSDTEPPANGQFGNAVRINNNRVLVGAWRKQKAFHVDDPDGGAYLYRNIDTASGDVYADVRLTWECSTSYNFGSSVDLLGSDALVGASGIDLGSGGAAYYYANVDQATSGSTITESAVLMPPGGYDQIDDRLGTSVKLLQGKSSWEPLSGTIALVGAPNWDGEWQDSGRVFFYSQMLDPPGGGEFVEPYFALGTALGTNGAPLHLGQIVDYCAELDAALAGAPATKGGSFDEGDYGYINIYSEISQRMPDDSVRRPCSSIMPSDPIQQGTGRGFGSSIDLQGTRFVIGCQDAKDFHEFLHPGKAFVGDLRAYSKLDSGNVTLDTAGMSVQLWTDWIIGQTTEGNVLTLLAGDSAIVEDTRAVLIGQEDNSHDNLLVVHGTLEAPAVWIGSGRNHGNALHLGPDADLSALDAIHLHPGSLLHLEGLDCTDVADLLASLGNTNLMMWDGGDWQALTEANAGLLGYQSSYDSTLGMTTVVPEPTTMGLLSIGGLALLRRRSGQVLRRRR